jgi:FixJ family two-component response regulator
MIKMNDPALPKLLLVDDDSLVRLSMLATLASNFDITEAATAEEALKIVELHPTRFGVAVIDLKLANSSGLELLRELKRREPLMEVIMITGFETMDAVKTAHRFGAHEFLNKPFNVAGLIEAASTASRLNQVSRMAARKESELREILHEMGPAADEWIRMQRAVSHDVRNMLCVVAAYFENVDSIVQSRHELGVESTGILKKHCSVISRQLETIVEIVTRHANVTRTDMGIPEQANVAAIITDLQMLMQRHPDAKSCQIRVSLPSSEVLGPLSPTETSQLLFNVLLNAAQSGGTSVDVTAEPDIAWPNDAESVRGFDGIRSFGLTEVDRRARFLRIAVRDNGAGIPIDLMTQFGKRRVTTKRNRGSGTGVQIILDVAAREKGVVTFRSSPGRGTEVEILLPLARAAQPLVLPK